MLEFRFCCTDLFLILFRLGRSTRAVIIKLTQLKFKWNFQLELSLAKTHKHKKWINPTKLVLLSFLWWFSVGVGIIFILADFVYLPSCVWLRRKLFLLKSLISTKDRLNIWIFHDGTIRKFKESQNMGAWCDKKKYPQLIQVKNQISDNKLVGNIDQPLSTNTQNVMNIFHYFFTILSFLWLYSSQI